MSETKFYFNWNETSSHNLYPSIVYASDPTIPFDPFLDELSEGEKAIPNPSIALETPLLTAAHLEDAPEYENNDPVYIVKLRYGNPTTPIAFRHDDYRNGTMEGQATNNLVAVFDYVNSVFSPQLKSDDGRAIESNAAVKLSELYWDNGIKANHFFVPNTYICSVIDNVLHQNVIKNLAVQDEDTGELYLITGSRSCVRIMTANGTPIIPMNDKPVAVDADLTIVHLNHYVSNSQNKIWYTKEVTSRMSGVSDALSYSSMFGKTRESALADGMTTWRTPNDYYNGTGIGTNDIKTGENAYVPVKSTKNDDRSAKPIWFWCNTLKNWCTYKHTSFQSFELFVWNGFNGWDSFKDIMSYKKYPSYAMNRYLYDLTRITSGTSVRETLVYDDMLYKYSSIRLDGDSKFSQYDENTFQTVKIGTYYLDDYRNNKRHPFSIGIPPIMRLPSGEIQIIYAGTIPGISDEYELIRPETIDFINSVCLAYFGDGSDKTIERDWKNFKTIKSETTAKASEIITDETSTLIYQPEINTIHKDENTLNITLSVPRQYPESVNGDYESFVEEWSK